MNRSDPPRRELVHRDDRWLVSDDLFAAFLARPMGVMLRRRLDREWARGGRPADIQLARERAYDAETERMRRDIRALADMDRRRA